MAIPMRVTHIFESLQGEGHLSGLYQCFVRVAGCSVVCPIRQQCDEPESLKFTAGEEREVQELALEVFSRVGNGGWCHVTGGEPTQQADLDEFLKALAGLGIHIHIQTSGVKRIGSQWDWLTVSPKCKPLELAQSSGQELKLINHPAICYDIDALRGWYESTKFWDYYVQPLWLPDGTSNVTETAELVMQANRAGLPYRMTMQAHKYWGLR
jgi:organic radical activating enzyme